MTEPRAATHPTRQRLELGLESLRIDRAAPARRRSPLLWAVPVAALVAGLALTWWLWPSSQAAARVQPAATDPAAGTQSAPVAPAGLLLGGYVQAHREIRLGAPVSGVVRALYVSPGSRVTAGERIAELANDTLKAQVEQARAAVAARRAELAELRHGARPQELALAGARVAELEAEQRRAQRHLERQRTLAEAGLIAASDLDLAVEGETVAAQRLEAARREEELLRDGPRQERVQRAEAALEEAEAARGLAEAQVEQTVIRAPVDGVVTQQHAETGELVSAGFGGGAAAALVTIADVSRLIVAIDVPLGEMHRVHLGQPARVESEALLGRRFAGRVTWIGPEANRQKLSVPIEVEILDADPELLPGLSAKVNLDDVDRGDPVDADSAPQEGGAS